MSIENDIRIAHTTASPGTHDYLRMQTHTGQHLLIAQSKRTLYCHNTLRAALRYMLAMRSGQQVDSTKQSASAVAFGSATRDSAGRMFISMDHEKSGYGRESPGETHSRWPASCTAVVDKPNVRELTIDISILLHNGNRCRTL